MRDAEAVDSRALSAPEADAQEHARHAIAVVVPHTHWDREWYLPFERMRFYLLEFFDHLIDVLEDEPDMVFVLDGQTIMIEDYLEVRSHRAEKICELVAAGRLRVGPFYVQPDEFHVTGESLVRNLLIGIQDSAALGGVMREGYLPDTFGHVHQLPQILQGFSIGTFYTMRGFGADREIAADEFWWEAPDGSRVRANWLSESYSNAAVLADSRDKTSLRHGALVNYDNLDQLLDRLDARSISGVVLLLNGGDHLLVQPDVPRLVDGLGAGAEGVDIRLGGLEEFHALAAEGPEPLQVTSGELRQGIRHDVFDGIGSTRTPLKVAHARVERIVCDLAERLDALATLVDGRSHHDSLAHLWRKLVANHAHDSICGCSVDSVHEQMLARFDAIEQHADGVVSDCLDRLTRHGAGTAEAGSVPIVVVNPSAFVRTGRVTAEVVPDLDAPLGQRLFGWIQGPGVDLSTYELLDEKNQTVPFTVVAGDQVTVVDTLHRRKEVVTDHLQFAAVDVPAMGAGVYRLVPRRSPNGDGPVEVDERPGAENTTEQSIDNGRVRVEVRRDGTLVLTNLATGRSWSGFGELLDDGDAGDEYSFGPMGEQPLSSRNVPWTVSRLQDGRLSATATLTVPAGAADVGQRRSEEVVDLGLALTVGLEPGSDRIDLHLVVANTARDHRLRLRVPVPTGARESIAESAFGVIRRPIVGTAVQDQAASFHEPPTGVHAMRRFVVVKDEASDSVEDDSSGVQLLAEGLHEYQLHPDGKLDLTLLRSVGWLARMDHPVRDHKIGPELPTPGAQCLGRHEFHIGLRLTDPGESQGVWFQQAEEFALPLQARAVQGSGRPEQPIAGAEKLGLSVSPASIVLSALKTAEDGRGLVVRVFNAGSDLATAHVQVRHPLVAAERCDLEEQARGTVALVDPYRVELPLAAGEIATLRLLTPPTP